MDLKEIVTEIRTELKAAFPACKFSVTMRHGNEVGVALMAAPESPFSSLEDSDGFSHGGKYAQLNHYHIEQDRAGNWTSNGCYLTPEAAGMFLKVVEIANRRNWDHSDLYSDYVSVNYFLHIAVGKWDRAFVKDAGRVNLEKQT
jgi:hypothetical protein